MLDNWKITAELTSPLAGDFPDLGAIMEYELAYRLGYKHAKKLTRNVPLCELERPPLPVVTKEFCGKKVWAISNPIVPDILDEWVEHNNKRIDTHKIASMLDVRFQKSLFVASGPYKMRHVPMRIRLVPRIVWFARGDRKGMNKLLKSICALGHKRDVGYGIVKAWTFERMEKDYSIFADCRGKPVLMKTIPFGPHMENVTGFRREFRGCVPPFWHPENFMEAAVPC
jgi:hypothetical protein